MKIAYLVHYYPKVSHSFIRREINELEAQGITVERFSIRSCAEELVDEADLLELDKTRFILNIGWLGLLLSLVQVILTRPIRFLKAFKLTLTIGWGSDRGVVRNFAYLAEACVLQNWLRETQVDHLHAHFGINPAAVAMLCHVLGGPTYSFTVHGPKEFDVASAIGLKEKIERAAFVVAISNFGQSQLYRWCNYKQWSKIQVVHCGVDKSFLDATHQLINHESRLVCVGRLCEQKGQLLLVEAVAQLAAQGIDFKLILVGDGELRGEIETLITHFNLNNHIEITGWASNSEVRKQLLAAKAMVLPSFAEGLPVVIMEALALNRPVISTYVAGIPELVEPGVCGYLVPPGSVSALTQAIAEVLALPIPQLEQMGKMGANKVAQQHNATEEARKLAQLFQAVKKHSAKPDSSKLSHQF